MSTRYCIGVSLLTLSLSLVTAGCDDGSGDADVADGGVDTSHAQDSDGAVDAVDTETPPVDTAVGVDTSAPPDGAILTADYAPNDLALGGGYLYFTESNTVRRIAVSGDEPVVEEMYTTGSMSWGTEGVAADADRFAWTERSGQSAIAGAVHACPHAGCPSPPDAFDKSESTQGIDLDGAIVAWTSPSRLNVQGATGAQGWSTPSTIAAPLDVVVDGTEVFWVRSSAFDTSMDGAFTCDANGGTCTPALLNDALGSPARIAVHGDHVVVLSDTGLFRMARDGGGVIRIADGADLGGDTLDVTTDGGDVYWAIKGKLFMCALAACTPALVADITEPSPTNAQRSRGLVMDEDAVYWATSNLMRTVGAIRRYSR